MNIQKISWKIYFNEPENARPESFFKIFNTWIPGSLEIFVDVADYKHVHDGTLILLAGHYVDYSLDDSGRRRGLVYSRKKPVNGTNEEKIQVTLKECLTAARRVEDDPEFRGEISFNTTELLFVVNDRGLVPNTKESFGKIKPILDTVLTGALDNCAYSLEHIEDPDIRFSVRITINKSKDITKLIDSL